jgi:hypothetical protein
MYGELIDVLFCCSNSKCNFCLYKKDGENCKNVKSEALTAIRYLIARAEKAEAELAKYRKGCEFCNKFDFSGASASIVDEKYPHIFLSLGSGGFPKEKQFNYCPMCGRKLQESEG